MDTKESDRSSHRGTVAIALIRPLAWELPYVVGAALEKAKRQKKKKKKDRSACFNRKHITLT